MKHSSANLFNVDSISNPGQLAARVLCVDLRSKFEKVFSQSANLMNGAINHRQADAFAAGPLFKLRDSSFQVAVVH